MRIVFLEETDSTNKEAIRRGSMGDIGPFWLGAYNQTEGKGRRGREWVSVRGNLLASGLYSLSIPENAANLSFIAALAVSKTLENYIIEDKIQLKWPNDVLVDGKKICGILLESSFVNKTMIVAIGIGINIVSSPEIDKFVATSIAKNLKPEIKIPFPGEMLPILAKEFQTYFEIWQSQGFAPLRNLWLKKCVGLNKAIIARTHNEEIEGIFESLGDNGELNLRDKDNILHEISAGDVFFV